MTVILDAGSKSANATIDASGLILGTSVNANNSARANLGLSSGIYAFEVGFAGGDVWMGLCNNATPPTSSGAGSLTVITFGNSVDCNGTFIGNWVVAYPALFIVDFDLRRAWIRTAGGNNWNNSPTATPCGGGGGIDISPLGIGPLYPFGITPIIGRTLTFNFGASAFSQTRPGGSCANSWDGSSPGVSNHALVNARMRAFRNTFTGLSHGHNIIGSPSMASAVIGATEPSDVCAMVVGNTVAGTLAETEPSDVCAMVAYVRDIPGVLDDGDRTYVPAEYPTIVPSVASSRFVIPSEGTVNSTGT